MYGTTILKKAALFLFFILSLQITFAQTQYYVSPEGAGSENGSSLANAATFADFTSFLRNYNVSSGTNLTVYFADGEYTVPVGGLTFSTNVTNLNAVFQPVTPSVADSKGVKFHGNGTGTSAVKFISTPTRAATTRMTLTVKDVEISNFHTTNTSESETGGTSLFTAGGYTTINLDNVLVNNISSNRTPFVALLSNSTINVANSVISNITKLSATYPAFAIFETAANYATFNIDNSTLDSWKTPTTSGSDYSHMFWIENDYITFALTNSTIKNNFTKNTLFRNSQPNSSINISANTFSGNITGSYLIDNINGTTSNIRIAGNTFTRNQTGEALIRANSAGSMNIYNNTFSDNTAPRAAYINTSNISFVSNTVYNSGLVRVENTSTSTVVKNNLVFGSSYIQPGSNGTNTQYNISDNKYYKEAIPSGGKTGGVAITNLLSYVSNELSDDPNYPDKPQTHPLLRVADGHHPILRMGSKEGYTAEMLFDQRGVGRPSVISIGAWDTRSIGFADDKYKVILYDPQQGLNSAGYEVDLSEFFNAFPEGVSGINDCTITIGYPWSGTVEDTGINHVKVFHPAEDPLNPGTPAYGTIGKYINIPVSISCTSSEGILFSGSYNVKVIIENIRQPLGLVDETSMLCKLPMERGSGDFTVNWKYKTNQVNGIGTRYDGFSIPLVGDLNGDGIAEIVALGINGGDGDGIGAIATAICILDGQTGKELVRYPLGTDQFTLRDPHHSSPGYIALVDADRNGCGEIILAIGYNGTTTSNRKKIVCFEVNEYTFLPVTTSFPANNTQRLTRKWVSNYRYDAYGTNLTSFHNDFNYFNRPIVQVVDINGDGEAEIVVYNKIYRATDGKLLAVLQDLGGTTPYLSTSYDTYKNYAFVGRNRITSNNFDRELAFSYIYDLDGDGTMEIIAGGKVYHNITLGDGNTYSTTCDVKLAENIKSDIYGSNQTLTTSISDGYTAVADINGDNKAEIIVAAFNGANDNLRIQVWDPGFTVYNTSMSRWEPASLTHKRDNSTMKLLAQIDVPFTWRDRQGSLSYVYIGDIDGKIDSKGRKLPEISILGSTFYERSKSSKVPLHPNLTEAEKAYFPLSDGKINYTTTTAKGALMSWTWDDSVADASPQDKLKVSFALEHSDRSANTGFTLFDFDNDGIQDICYRDETSLRIISATVPFVKITDGVGAAHGAIRFKETVYSWTGFEYPVIADLDGDGSADMVVMGNYDTVERSRGYVYAVQSTLDKKFAPAPMVWNQFMYHPLRINEDLTIPRVNLHPLSDDYAFVKHEDEASGVKTYIYNNTITQAVKSALFDPDDASKPYKVLRPIVPIPDVRIDSARIDRTEGVIKFWITNVGDASVNKFTPVRIFEGEYTPANVPSRLTWSFNLDTTINVGQSVPIIYPRTGTLTTEQMSKTYTIRVTDESTSTNDTFGYTLTDCNWGNNFIEVSDFMLRNDAVTVLQFEDVVIDILANDLYPETCGGTFYASDITVDGYPAGQLKGDFGQFSINNNKLHYTAPAAYPAGNGVVKVNYRISCEGTEKSANLYIYILESCNGSFAGCLNDTYTVCLNRYFPGVVYNWYDGNMNSLGTNFPSVILNSEKTFYVKPVIPASEHAEYATIDFPAKQLTISALGTANSSLMKWTGARDTNWNNPNNWVNVDSRGKESPVFFTPTGCVSVIIPSGIYNYPVLTASAACDTISMQNRAMLKGIHHLNYSGAKVEFTINTEEHNRFLMWSSPLKQVYTGDYHEKNTNGEPRWGNVFMSFFQSRNPDDKPPYTEPQENVFTSTFGNLETQLSLGTPFIMKIEKFNAPTTLTFPQTADKYVYTNGSVTGTLNRNGAYRFITDQAVDANGNLNLPVNGDNMFRVIQVVNPFMAWLRVKDFLEHPSNSSILAPEYKVWDGNVNNGFVTVKYTYDQSGVMRYAIVDDPLVMDTDLEKGLIAPLQSFFVIKKNPLPVTQLYMNVNMTTVEGSQSPYPLTRATRAAENNMLRIEAVQDGNRNMAVLHNLPGSSSGYDSREDSYKLFNEMNPVSVYTLSSSGESLAVNTREDFSGKTIPIGLKLISGGDTYLNFEGVRGFGYKVSLIDHKQGKTIDLSKTSSYKFTVDKPSPAKGLFEVNDRFFLSFGIATDITDVEDSKILKVEAGKGCIYVSTTTGEEIGELQVYTTTGEQVYAASNRQSSYVIHLSSHQIYLVKTKIGNTVSTVKVVTE